MSLETGLFNKLATTTAVANLVRNATSPATYRIFPSIIPQGQAMPAIRYEKISVVRPQTLGGPAGFLQARFQIDVWADTDAAVTALADAVVAAIDGTRGDFGGATIQHGYLEDFGRLPEFDAEETGYRVTMDFVILADG
jgi:hypothetical protein